MTLTSPAAKRLTPDVVQAVRFPTSRLGRRGLDEDHVRVFCKQVEIELIRLLNERTNLEDEVRRLRARVLGQVNDDFPGRRDDSHVQAVGILSKAQITADRYVADAQEYSRRLAAEARRRRDEILAEARTTAALALQEAHDSGRRAAEVALSEPSPSGNERRELEAELAYLRTFCDVYRTHLRAYLDALLRNLDEWERAERASVADVPVQLSAGSRHAATPATPATPAQAGS
jgi:cell division septum initiation protein DivIVA